MFLKLFEANFSPHYEDSQDPNKQNQGMDLFRTDRYSEATIIRRDLSATILFKLVDSYLIAFKFAQ